ncbi:hypothetical protein LTR64_006768 [Lithohypha guttulata]|uniref:uncharacterized protein n=1 Tax=Lithohypha guttulata TaxID=1690604 RepID=UPI002DE1B3A1|nr:hypothetical protein LTR51_004674 [Lithohypha guttulata]
MKQILSTSALHLSITRSEQRNFYHQHATQLQSEAAAGYNSILEKLDESNIVAAFLMSSLLGLHVFCDTFLFRDADFSHTLDALLGCMSLLRGVRVVIGNWWTYLLSSELDVILMDATSKHQRGIDNTFRNEDLERLVSGADISDASRKIYRETIDELGHLFAMEAGLPEPEVGQSANMIFAWLVVAPQEYAELLSARRPEALIILSYYAVVLHHRRSFWAVGDAGKYLIDAIGTHLGRHWDAWLAWPRSMAAS